MMRSLYTGVSGLSNHQTRMDVLSNNIANVNTTGFKASRTVFSSALSQTIQGATSPQGNVGGINAKQIGLGVKTAAIDILFTKTSFQTTNVNTDLAINDNGFFIVNNGAQSFYTRAGNFGFDEDGSFVNVDGLKVMGWLADKTGNINTAAPIEAIKIPVTDTMDPKITTYLDAIGNLDSSAGLGMIGSSSKDVFDSQGFAHRVSTNYTKVGDNQWLAATDVKGVEPGTTVQGTIKRISFDAYGKYMGSEDVTLAGQPSKAVFLTAFNSKLDLPNDAMAGGPITDTVTYQDSAGNAQTITITATLTSPATAVGATDAEWEVEFDFGGGTTPQTQTISSTNQNPSWNPMVVTIGTDTVSFTPNTQITFESGVTPAFVSKSGPTRTVGTAVSDAFTAAGIELDRNARLNDTKEGAITFMDSDNIPRALGVKATCTAAPNGANPATWKLEFIENGKVVGSQSYSTLVANDLPPLTLTDGSMVSFTGAGSSVTIGNTATALNTVPMTPTGTDMPLSFQPAGGTASPLSINMSYNALTQYAGGFNMGDPKQDGYSAGDLKDKVIDASGTIIGKYSNGQMLKLGQVATAIFNNQQGLERAGSTLFTASNNSGDPIIGTAGTGGRGTMQAGAIEMANVDLAEEFTNMIVTQRGYQSNSRVITTSDEMLQELMSLKR